MVPKDFYEICSGTRPAEMKPTKEQRFWAKVNKNGPIPSHRPELGKCWIWIGSIATDGYGKLKSKIGSELKNERAHRISWQIHNGKIPEGKLICHHCDNILCVRDTHLFAGTPQLNVDDMISKGRQRYKPRCKLTKVQVAELKSTPRYEGMFAMFARKFGVHWVTIYDAYTGRTWKTLTA